MKSVTEYYINAVRFGRKVVESNGNEFIVFGGDVEVELCTDPFAFLCHQPYINFIIHWIEVN